jgi:hypothetical protein
MQHSQSYCNDHYIYQSFDATKSSELQQALENDEKAKTDATLNKILSQQISTAVRQFIQKMHSRMMIAINLATERSIRSLSQRILNLKPIKNIKPGDYHQSDNLFSCEFELYNEALRISPTTKEMTKGFEDIIHIIFSISKKIPLWNAKDHYYDSILH